MSSVILSNIVMKRESKSFTDSLYAVLTGAGLFEGPKYRLSGLSGMAFKFTVHEHLLPLSVTAYGQWGTEHKPAVDNLGIASFQDSGRTRHPSFPYYQQAAIPWIKQSLDQGIGVIYWIPEFGVIHGYDDEDRVLYVLNGRSKESQIVLYDNLGLNFTEFWYCRTVEGKVEKTLQETVLESLRLALHDWETPFKTLPNRDIASGRLAYTFLIRALEQGDYHEQGAVYIMESYLYSRKEIIAYLQDVQHSLDGLEEVAYSFTAMEPLFARLKQCFTEPNKTRQVDKRRIKEISRLLADLQQLEEQAMDHCRSISGRFPDLTRTTLPRWGAHIPR